MNCPLCEVELKDHPAVTCLDVLVAKMIMGLVPCDKWQKYDKVSYVKFQGTCQHEACYPAENPPKYSSNMSAAAQVIQKMRDNKWNFYSKWQDNEKPWAMFGKGDCWCYGESESDSLPLSICLSALQAILRYNELATNNSLE